MSYPPPGADICSCLVRCVADILLLVDLVDIVSGIIMGYQSRQGRKLQFFDRQLQIFNRGDYV